MLLLYLLNGTRNFCTPSKARAQKLNILSWHKQSLKNSLQLYDQNIICKSFNTCAMDIFFANFLLVTESYEIWYAAVKRHVWGKSEAKRLKQKQVWTRPWSLELCACYLCASVCLVVGGEQVNTVSLVLPGELKDLRLFHHEIDHMCVWAGLHCIIGASCLLVGGTVLERCVTARRECVCEYMDGNQSWYKCWCVPAVFKLEQSTQGEKRRKTYDRGRKFKERKWKVVRVTDVNDGGRFRECGEEYEVCQDKFCLSSAVVCGKVLVHTRKKEFSKQKSRQQSTIPQMTAGRTTWFHELKSKDSVVKKKNSFMSWRETELGGMLLWYFVFP